MAASKLNTPESMDLWGPESLVCEAPWPFYEAPGPRNSVIDRYGSFRAECNRKYGFMGSGVPGVFYEAPGPRNSVIYRYGSFKAEYSRKYGFMGSGVPGVRSPPGRFTKLPDPGTQLYIDMAASGLNATESIDLWGPESLVCEDPWPFYLRSFRTQTRTQLYI